MDLFKWKDSNGMHNLVEANFVTASQLGVNYAIDPRNYLNEVQIFQFESLDYDSFLQTKEGVEKILYGTLMYRSNISYTDVSGNRCELNKTYSDAIIEASEVSQVSPYHLASRIKQETGCDIISNTSICGTISGYIGYYNYYNIGATGDNPHINGLAYARNAGWTSPELAIKGGARFIRRKIHIKRTVYSLLRKIQCK